MGATSKWHKFPGLPKWSPEIVPTGLPELWTAITPDCRVGSQRGLNQSCSPRQDLSNAMSHTQIGRREEVDSRLLVVGSQTTNLTPGPSFAHNLGCRCPNCQCEGIFDIYVSRPFQWHQEHPIARCFSPLLSSSKHSGVPEDSQSQLFQVLGFTPTLGQSRGATLVIIFSLSILYMFNCFKILLMDVFFFNIFATNVLLKSVVININHHCALGLNVVTLGLVFFEHLSLICWSLKLFPWSAKVIIT